MGRRPRSSEEPDSDHRESKNARDSRSYGYCESVVDLEKIPSSVFRGLKKGNASAALLNAENLEAEDAEVWIFQCTKNVQLADITEGKKLVLDCDRPTHLKCTDDQDREFESVCVPLDNEERGNIATLLPDQDGNIKLVSTPLAGYIMLRESVPELPPPFFDVSPPLFHQLPPGLKHRHPVYGVDFTELLAKMEGNDDPEIFHKKSKKQKGGKIYEHDNFPAEVNGSLLKKSKKKRSSNSESDNIVTVTEIPAYNKNVQLIETQYQAGEEETDSSKRKKSKKRKKNFEEVEEPEIPVYADVVDTMIEETEEEPRQKKSKKKKKHHEQEDFRVEIPSQEYMEDSFETHDEVPSSKRKKSKKRKREEEVDDEVPIHKKSKNWNHEEDCVDNGFGGETPKKKKMSKHKTVESERLDGEEDSTPHKKHKEKKNKKEKFGR